MRGGVMVVVTIRVAAAAAAVVLLMLAAAVVVYVMFVLVSLRVYGCDIYRGCVYTNSQTHSFRSEGSLVAGSEIAQRSS